MPSSIGDVLKETMVFALVQREEGSIMVAGVIGFASVLFNHDPFLVPRPPAQFWIYVIFAISALREVSFTIVERTPAHVSRRRFTLALLYLMQQVSRLLWRLSCPETCRDLHFGRGGWCRITCSNAKGIRVLCRGCWGVVNLRDRTPRRTGQECQDKEHRRYKSCGQTHHRWVDRG